MDGAAWVPAIPILLSMLVGWRAGVLRKRDAFATALEADEKLDLKETLSSAYAFIQPDSVRRMESAKPASGVLTRLASLFARRVLSPADSGSTPITSNGAML